MLKLLLLALVSVLIGTFVGWAVMTNQTVIEPPQQRVIKSKSPSVLLPFAIPKTA